jgi:hypothetical protein
MSLRTTDRYSHTDQDLEYRREAAEKAGIGKIVVGPNSPKPANEAAKAVPETVCITRIYNTRRSGGNFVRFGSKPVALSS